MDKKFKKYYALKEISKVKVIDKKSINSIIYERELLSRLNHSLIINLKYAFQDYNNLYLVLDLLTGGDLRYQIGHHRKRYFTEQQTKFFISCIIESLIYIHSKNIIHRDIKPENLVFDSKGYLHTTDFGIAKFMSKKNLGGLHKKRELKFRKYIIFIYLGKYLKYINFLKGFNKRKNKNLNYQIPETFSKVKNIIAYEKFS